MAAKCDPGIQSIMVVIWVSLVQIIMINTSAIVAVDDREGRNIGPPFELLVQGSWTFYLGITYQINLFTDREDLEIALIVIGCEVIPFALTCAKMVFRYYAFEKTRRSFALGKNPHLIFAYMQQPPPVQAGTSHRREAAVVTDEDAPPPPPLLVMGDGKRHMEKQSHGYVWKGDSGMAVHGKDGLLAAQGGRPQQGVSDQKSKVRVPAAVKLCIIQVLRRTGNGVQLSNGAACLRRRGQVGESFLWACSNKSTSHTILTWHIATSILEVRYPHLHDEEQGSPPLSNTDYKMVATYLSRYCACLVTWCPELLPDDHEWSRSLYEDVKKDARRVLAGCTAGDSLTPEAKCQQLVELLSAKAKHQVVKDGAKLGEQLVKLVQEGGDDMVWKLLAEFWSEMILFVAPSDNLKGHKAAIARGGELITLLGVLLFHAGIISRPGEDDGAASATSAAGVV
ncbi:unnamed protein product [Miscanthus lutarioriparius]|uniref:DUF4220 domain-containing protein n=1 Tax=Miscanthus lutarioriparius TaxID=422564 RepID=A0A811NFI2_9POAL|nr:unnamed protein product [Miscanthus lutarioriparius]